MIHMANLIEVPAWGGQILKGQIKGCIVVDVNA